MCMKYTLLNVAAKEQYNCSVTGDLDDFTVGLKQNLDDQYL